MTQEAIFPKEWGRVQVKYIVGKISYLPNPLTILEQGFEDPRYSKGYVDWVHKSTTASVFTQLLYFLANLSIRHII